MERIKVAVEFCHENAKCPVYATEKAAGCDFYSPINGTVPPKGTAVIRTGVKMVIPEGYYLEIKSRSGLAAKFSIEKGAGTIDEDYRKEIGIVLHNLSDKPFHFAAGDRIAQGVFARYWQADFELVDSVEDNGRGGFGSTGMT